MARPKAREPEFFDAELAELPQAARWREWMGRVEAAIIAARAEAGGSSKSSKSEIWLALLDSSAT